MKTFNFARLVVVASLFVAGFAFAGSCKPCATSCKPCEKSCPSPKLPLGEETWTETRTCDKRPKVRFICRKEIIPCPGEPVTIEHKGCPEYVGTIMEDGSEVDMNGQATETVTTKKMKRSRN